MMYWAIKIYLALALIVPLPAILKGSDDEAASRLKEFRKYMLDEVNFVRTKPAEYADARLIKDKENKTDNGAYRYLKRIKPVKI